MKKMTDEGIEVVYGIGHKKSDIQKDYENILDCYTKLLRYEESLEIMGERNSYCKTDHDATMMNMKYDYYNQTGVFKPGYNLQIGVSDSYIVHIDIYSNPTDTKTYIPFMKAYKERYGVYPKWPIGDAGYGSYDNLMFNIMNKIELGLKYNYYAKKNESKFKKQIYNPLNWEEDNQGLKVCPEGHSFDQRLEDKWNDKGDYLQISQVFECGKCDSCIHKSKCTKAKGERRIHVNRILKELHSKVDENLGSEEGKEMKKQRSIQAEGTFGVIKQDMEYIRLRRRGRENIEIELFLIAIAFNLRKYHNNRIRKSKELIS